MKHWKYALLQELFLVRALFSYHIDFVHFTSKEFLLYILVEILCICLTFCTLEGHCVEFNVPGGVIQDQISAACNETFPKCDASYLSSTAYKCKKTVSYT